jgi:DNA-binding MarR family transcriptional regulator
VSFIGRVRVESLTPKGKELITPVFRKHAAEIEKIFADAGRENCEVLKLH